MELQQQAQKREKVSNSESVSGTDERGRGKSAKGNHTSEPKQGRKEKFDGLLVHKPVQEPNKVEASQEIVLTTDPESGFSLLPLLQDFGTDLQRDDKHDASQAKSKNIRAIIDIDPRADIWSDGFSEKIRLGLHRVPNAALEHLLLGGFRILGISPVDRSEGYEKFMSDDESKDENLGYYKKEEVKYVRNDKGDYREEKSGNYAVVKPSYYHYWEKQEVEGYIINQDVIGTSVHEIGHAIDAAIGQEVAKRMKYRDQGLASEKLEAQHKLKRMLELEGVSYTPQFRKAYKKDLSELDERYKTSDPKNGDNTSSLAHFIGRDDEAKANEAFAESISVIFLGKNRNPSAREFVSQFRNSIKAVEVILEAAYGD